MSNARVLQINERNEVVFRTTVEGLPTTGLYDGMTVKYLDGTKKVNIYYKTVWYEQ